MTRPLRAAIYARFSTDMQSDSSIDDQVRTCREFADQQGLEIVEIYSDRATSGASLMRSGIQKLLRDADAGAFDVVISEAMDRLSRNQADIATIFQKLQFRDVMIETTSEGTISEMHIGLKGTMNALFLKDLAAKTRRGLKGRALAGKSAGGKAYGYKNVVKFDAAGEPIRGDRKIDAAEAGVVRHIFTDYANGTSPKKIAMALNAEGVAGPSGKGWGASTLHGNRERGTGILNNELYIGSQVWNRLTYAKDPDTGKRQARPNPPEDWTRNAVPDLRIIDDDLWTAVKTRQGSIRHTMLTARDESSNSTNPLNGSHRAKYLFSGLLKCGCCGGSYTLMNKTKYGCAAARNKGTCDNRLLIKREDFEARVLEGLKSKLLNPGMLTAFVAEYQREWNKLQRETLSDRSTHETELKSVTTQDRQHGGRHQQRHVPSVDEGEDGHTGGPQDGTGCQTRANARGRPHSSAPGPRASLRRQNQSPR